MVKKYLYQIFKKATLEILQDEKYSKSGENGIRSDAIENVWAIPILLNKWIYG